ncbi:MAG: hypothetical protein EOS34_20900 [Mesorhizobium sp.]|nr:MAG: hypothetical protein EOS34_20900 [Mesorhizobium sp.]
MPEEPEAPSTDAARDLMSPDRAESYSSAFLPGSKETDTFGILGRENLSSINGRLDAVEAVLTGYFAGEVVADDAGALPPTAPQTRLPDNPVSRSEIFERVHQAIMRALGTRNASLAEQLAKSALAIAAVETKAYEGQKTLGTWAFLNERSGVPSGRPKCNVFFGEIAKSLGIEPMTVGRGFATTRQMLAENSHFRCWRRTQDPKVGDAGVYSHHVFIVTDPGTGGGVSALSKHVKEGKYFEFSSDAKTAHPNIAWHRKSGFERIEPGEVGYDRNDPGKVPEVIFFEYHCPDVRQKKSK